MNDEGKAKILRFVGLEWYEVEETEIAFYCDHCKTKIMRDIKINIDPTTCCGMAKVWEAFKKDEHRYYEFLDRLDVVSRGTFSIASYVTLVTNPIALAAALLEYIEEKEGE